MSLDVNSPAFALEFLPVEYSADGRNVSPPLQWSPGPAGTLSYALIMDDPDGPRGIWAHWVAWNIRDTQLLENLPKQPHVETRCGRICQGVNSFGRIGYIGPCPPCGTHRYFFKVYALGTEQLDLTPDATRQDLLDAMESHILDFDELEVTYSHARARAEGQPATTIFRPPPWRPHYVKRIAEDFLRLHGRGWQIADADRETPDFILANADSQAGLELTSFCEQGPHNEAHARDSALRSFVHDLWLYDDLVNESGIYLHYKKGSDGRFAMPKPNSWPALVGELRALVMSIDEPLPNRPTRFPFVANMQQQAASRLAGRPVDPMLRAEKFPTISAHFDEVVITNHPGVKLGMPLTSASCRNTAVDGTELKRVLGDKLTKLSDYRANLPGDAPIFLLIHSDGWPPTAHISNDLLMQEALRVARTVVTRPGDDFDEVWWLDNACVGLDGKLYRVA